MCREGQDAQMEMHFLVVMSLNSLQFLSLSLLFLSFFYLICLSLSIALSLSILYLLPLSVFSLSLFPVPSLSLSSLSLYSIFCPSLYSLPLSSLSFSLLFPQAYCVQMCDIINEIAQEREHCEIRAAENVTSGNIQNSNHACCPCSPIHLKDTLGSLFLH